MNKTKQPPASTSVFFEAPERKNNSVGRKKPMKMNKMKTSDRWTANATKTPGDRKVNPQQTQTLMHKQSHYFSRRGFLANEFSLVIKIVCSGLVD